MALILILFVVIALFLTNFSPGTWLIGWDNLLPELNLSLNLKRSLLAVWQQYQGLGLVGGNAHAADLPRQLLLILPSLILPQSFIRYFVTFLLLFIGPAGVYLGLRRHLHFDTWIALLSSLFYLLNFGTIQYFWVPFEPFSVFWAAFPWLIFSLWAYLRTPCRPHLRKVILVNLLAIPSFYIPTLFLVYLICLFLIFLAFYISSSHNQSPSFFKGGLRGILSLRGVLDTAISLPSSLVDRFPRSSGVATTNFRNFSLKSYILSPILKVLLLIFTLNSFWLLPSTYFFLTNRHQTTDSFANLISTQETSDRNHFRGTLADFALLRGFYFDFPQGETYLMLPWRQHFAQHLPLLSGLLLFVIVIIGLISLVIRPPTPISLSLIFLFVLSLTTLAARSFPINLIHFFLIKLPLIEQIFRAPWTKFIVPAIFAFSILSAYSLLTLSRPFKHFSFLISTPYALLLAWLSLPAFHGLLFYSRLKTPLPGAYQELAAYLGKQPVAARIAYLPAGNFWGWSSYRFGYSGSGFLWYLLPQPILDRAFDVWNLKNEQFYWQLDFALQRLDPSLLAAVFHQYSIEYVLYDDKLYFPYPDGIYYAHKAAATPEVIARIPGIQTAGQFGHLTLYRLPDNSSPYLLNRPPSATSPSSTALDLAYYYHGDYLSASDSQPTYPLSRLLSPRFPQDISPLITANDNNISLSSPNLSFPPHNLILPQSAFRLDHSYLDPPLQQIESASQSLRLQNTLSTKFTAFSFPHINFNHSYLLQITYRHVSGYPLRLAVLDHTQRLKFFETKLSSNNNDFQTDWFFLPQMDRDVYNYGLVLLFINSSFDNTPSINDIKSIRLFLTPIDFFPDSSRYTPPARTYLDPLSPSIFFHRLALPPDTPTTHLVLPQSFDSGWLAFTFSGIRPIFLKHVLANNWANAWELNHCSSTTYFLFWPQLLEFLGLALLLLTFFYLPRRP